MKYCYTDSPIGPLLLAGDEDGLAMVGFPTGKMQREPDPDWAEDAAPFAEAIRQLGEYFDGQRRRFDLKLRPGGTEFQRRVLDALKDIPYGETVTYKDIAERIGSPKAVRAVGAANGQNPIPIIIPCHRVIGSSGKLTGFGGGLETKAALLRLEAEGSASLI